MDRRFYLPLMIGGFNADPVSQPVIDALTEVQVSSTVGSQAGFQLKFTIGKNSPVQQMHNSGYFDPRRRVIIAGTLNGSADVPMDGIPTNHDISPNPSPGQSTVAATA